MRPVVFVSIESLQVTALHAHVVAVACSSEGARRSEATFHRREWWTLENTHTQSRLEPT